jgi:hypothetical protein
MTRLRWLADLTNKLRPLFQAAERPLPPMIFRTEEINGLSVTHCKEGTWHITLSNALKSKTEVAEVLIANLVRRACPEEGVGLLSTLIGYGPSRPDGNKLAWGLRRLVQAMPPYPPKMTRKSWLTRLVDELRPLFDDAGHPLPEIKASPGWMDPEHPRSGMVKFTTGECLVFIWPQLSNSIDAAFALVRQLPLCATDVRTSEHTVDEVARQIGITNGRPPSPALKFLLNNIIADLGPYPEN